MLVVTLFSPSKISETVSLLLCNYSMCPQHCYMSKVSVPVHVIPIGSVLHVIQSRQEYEENVRFEVRTMVKMRVLLWVMMLCGFTGRHQRFRGTYCLHLQGSTWKQYVSPLCWNLPTTSHSVTTQKNTIMMKKVCFKKPSWTEMLIKYFELNCMSCTFESSVCMFVMCLRNIVLTTHKNVIFSLSHILLIFNSMSSAWFNFCFFLLQYEIQSINCLSGNNVSFRTQLKRKNVFDSNFIK
jgi:hypothetical protein